MPGMCGPDACAFYFVLTTPFLRPIMAVAEVPEELARLRDIARNVVVLARQGQGPVYGLEPLPVGKLA